MTTIAISVENAAELNRQKRGFDSYDDVLSRLFTNQADVYTEFVLIDNELPQLHTCVFQLGEDNKSLYYWNGQAIAPISLADSNKLLKQPKHNITLTKKELFYILTHDIEKVTYMLDFEVSKMDEPEGLVKQLKNFVESSQHE